MRWRRSSALVVAACLAGCATKPAYQAKLPQLGDNCVQQFDSVKRTPLRALDAKTHEKQPYVEFADVAQCLSTTDGSTTLALYALEAVSPPAQIHISILPSAGGTFAAAVELLDANFKRIEQYPFADFTRRGGEYSLVLFVNDVAPAYVMLVPDLAQVGKQETMVGSVNNLVMVPAGPMIFMFNNGAEVKPMRAFMAGGKLKVSIRQEGSAAFFR